MKFNVLTGSGKAFPEPVCVINYDIVDPSAKRIIEFNGDYWHANPKIYEASSIMHNNKTAQELWDYDLIKRKIAENLGYTVYYVWETEYKDDEVSCLQKCLNFLND